MKRSTFTMRRLLALVLVLIMVGSLFAGCSKKTDDPTVPSEPNETIAGTAAPTDEPTVAPTQAPTEAPTEPAPTVPPVLMGTVNADNLNVRSEPYSTADILKRLAINTRIEILEQKIVDGVNWGRIAEGWVNLNYVTIGVEFPEPGTDNNTGTGTGSVVNNNTNIGTGSVTTNNTTEGVVTTGLNIRKDSNANADRVGSYSKGDKVTILERSNGWGRTNKGWINLDYVDFSGKTTASSGSSSSSSGTNSATVSNGNSVPLGNGTVVKTTSLAIRSGPGANYTQVSYIRKGETHDYFQTSSNGWVRLKKGWVNADYLELEYYVDEGAEVTVTVNELSVREEPDYDSTKLATLDKNDDVEILEVKGTWGKIEYADGQYGWIDLDKVKLPTPDSSTYSTGIATVTAEALHVREKASASSDSLGVVEEGDKFDVIEVKGNWGKIEYEDDYGWINLKYTKMKSTYTTGTGYITASKLNVREEPDEDSDKIGTLENGDKVIILDTEGNWGKILYDEDDDEYGWISLKYVRMTSSSTESGSGSSSSGSSTSGKYKVTIDTPVNGTLKASASSCNAGTTVTLTATPASGKKLSHVVVKDKNGDNVTVSNNKFTMPSSNVTVSAVFVDADAPATYAITENYSGGYMSLNVSDPSAVTAGKKVIMTAVPNSGKTLSSLTVKDKDGKAVDVTNNSYFTMPASDVTIKAVFTDVSSNTDYYTISQGNILPADISDKATLSFSTTTAAKGDKVTIYVTTKSGYSINSVTVKDSDGKSVDRSGSGSTYTFTMPASDVTVNLGLTAKQFNVVKKNVTGCSVSTSQTNYTVGSTVTVSVSVDKGYVLTGMKVYGHNNSNKEVSVSGGSSSFTFTMPAFDVTIEPVIEAKHAVVVDSEIKNGTVTVSKKAALAGETITVTATPDFGYKLKKLEVNGIDITDSGSFIVPDTKATVTATFEFVSAKYKVNHTDGLNLRKTASSSGEILIEIPYEAVISSQAGSTATWIKTTYGGHTGYAKAEFLTPVS